MATYVIRNGRVMAKVKIKPFRPISKTFATKEEAEAWATAVETGLRQERDERSPAGTVSTSNGRLPRTRAEIVMLPRFQVNHLSTGVYFLMKGDVCVYVGSSKNVFVRVRDHARGSQKKDFDNFAWIACRTDEMADLERQYIQLLMPIHNHDFIPKKFRSAHKKGQLGMKRPYAGDASRFGITKSITSPVSN